MSSLGDIPKTKVAYWIGNYNRKKRKVFDKIIAIEMAEDTKWQAVGMLPQVMEGGDPPGKIIFELTFGAQWGFKVNLGSAKVGLDITAVNYEIYTNDPEKNGDGRTTVENSIGLEFFGIVGGEIGQQQDIKIFDEGSSRNYIRYVEFTNMFHTQRAEYDVFDNERVSGETVLFDLKFF